MRVEEILDAVVIVLGTLTSFTGKVFRGNVYDLSVQSQMPALNVYMGADVLESEISQAYYNWELFVHIDVKAQQLPTNSQIDELLNTYRGEIHAALIADYTLGLDFIIDLNPVSADEPVLSGDGDQPIGSQRLTYIVKYRTSRTDLSA